MLRSISTRALALLLALAVLADLGLAWGFSRIPSARAYVPLRIVTSTDIYDWSPADAPRWFRPDDPSIPEAAHFQAPLQSRLGGSDPFERYLSIMDWVRAQAAVEDADEAIPGDPITVHQAMQQGTPAQCGNFATLLVAASASVGLTEVRTWHLLADDGPGWQGHVANEVWIPELGKWVFLDPMNNTYVLLDGIPASLLEVRQMVLAGQEARLVPVMGANTHTPPDRLFDLYRTVMVVPALAPAHRPLRSAYGPLGLSRLIPLVPDVDGARSLSETFLRAANGESRLVVLMDDLAQARSQPYPVALAKALFAALLGASGLTVALVGWLLRRALRAIGRAIRKEKPVRGREPSPESGP